MKKFFTCFMAVSLLFGMAGCASSNEDKKYAGQTLYVYNWGEYTGQEVIPMFEKQTGAKVVMDNFESNEQMYIKIDSGESYDVLVPSDYMIERLISEDKIQKLDKSKLNCMDLLVDGIKGLPYDPNN
ncbi:ABC transporter substrate-binding protein, partial [Amedibacterium intestinale]